MKKINSYKLLKFLKESGKLKLKTLARGSDFLAEWIPNGIRYIPKTGKHRGHPLEYLNRVVNKFNQTGSLKPGYYSKLTRNASYTVSLIREYLTKGRKIFQKEKFLDFEKRSAMEGYQSDRKYLYTSRNRPIVEERKRRDKFRCQACRFKLKINNKFIIECHHKIPFYGKKIRVTNIEELVCLCPTCHRIAHIQKPPLSVKRIKSFLKRLNSK